MADLHSSKSAKSRTRSAAPTARRAGQLRISGYSGPSGLPVRRRSPLPVLALHSSASTGGQWKALAQSMRGQRRVLTPDLPGYGNPSVCTAMVGPADLGGEADWVLRQARLPAGPFHLVGHSYGAAVALKLALSAPERVCSLTLVEPVLFHLLMPGGANERRLFRQIIGVRDRLRGAVAAGWPAHGMAAFVDFWSGEGFWQTLDLAKRQALAGQARSVVRNFDAALGETWPIEEVASLRAPLQLIYGNRSQPVTLRLTDLLIDVAQTVTATGIFGAGHMAPVTHATAVNAMIGHHIETAEDLWHRDFPMPAASPLVA